MFYFKYNQKIDEEYQKHLAILGTKFGHTFSGDFKIKESNIIEAKRKVGEFQKTWNEYEDTFREKFPAIYNYNFPEVMDCYVNTSPYSMVSLEKNYLSISVQREGSTFLASVLHEANHFIFIRYYSDFCRSIGCSSKDIDEMKEFLTVINNDVFYPIQDCGWEVYREYRDRVLVLWKKNKDIKEVIIDAKKALDEKKKLGIAL